MSLLRFKCRHRFPGGFELNLDFTTDQPVTALVGPSGAGKTSILMVLAGLLRPLEAYVQLGDRLLTDTATKTFVPIEQRHLGLVFQDHLLFPHLTVEANLRYGMLRRPAAKGIEFSRVVQVLELSPLLKRFPQRLSGGERQRVALGRALLSGPELLLMDEPLTALDHSLKERILDYLERVLAEWNVPTLLVSHTPGEVRRLANWVVLLERGEIVGQGTASETIHH